MSKSTPVIQCVQVHMIINFSVPFLLPLLLLLLQHLQLHKCLKNNPESSVQDDLTYPPMTPTEVLVPNELPADALQHASDLLGRPKACPVPNHQLERRLDHGSDTMGSFLMCHIPVSYNLSVTVPRHSCLSKACSIDGLLTFVADCHALMHTR